MLEKEQKFISIFEEYQICLLSNKNPKDWVLYYNKEGKCLIKHNKKNNITWIRYIYIWSIFEKEYNMNYEDIQSFMKDQLLKHFKIMGTTPLKLEDNAGN